MGPGDFYDATIYGLTTNYAAMANVNYGGLQQAIADSRQAQMQAMQNLYQIPQEGAFIGGSYYHGSYVPPADVPKQPPVRVKCEGCGAESGERHKVDCEAMKDRCDCHAGRASKAHRFVELLRMELDAWHGNILEGSPA